MIAATIIAEDTALHIKTHNGLTSTVTLADNTTGEETTRDWTNVQLGAVLALLFAGDDFPSEISTVLYEIAEPAVEGLGSMRPIP